MPTYTEDLSESFALSGLFGPSEYTKNSCASLTFASVLTHSKDFGASDGLAFGASASFDLGFNVIEAMTLGAAAGQTKSTQEAAVAGIVLRDLVSQVLAAMPSDSLALAAVASGEVVTPVASGFALSAVASAVREVAHGVSDGVAIDAEVETSIVYEVVDGFEVGVSQQVSIDAVLIENVGLGASAAAHAIVQATLSAAFVLAQSYEQTLTATTDLSDGFAIGARELIADLTYPSLWANSELMASAVWRQTPFESYAYVGGRLLAAGVDGLYAFGAAQDGSGPVLATVTGDLSDHGSEKKKVFDCVNVAGVLGAPIRVTVTTELGSYAYTTHLPSSAKPTTHRAAVGRGHSGRYVRFTIDNLADGDEGSDFSINGATARFGDSSRVR